MSDKKPALGGLFVNKKSSASPAAAAGGAAKPKNVKQRWMYIGIAAVGFIVISSSFFGKKAPVVPTVKKTDDMISVTPANLEKLDFATSAGQSIKQVEGENARLKSELDSLKTAVSQIKADADKKATIAIGDTNLPAGVVAPPVAGNKATVGNPPPAPPTPILPENKALPKLAVPAGTPFDTPGALIAPQEPQVFKPEPRAASATTQDSGELVKANIKYRKNPYSGFLPAGSFAPVVLLNGLDAGTSSTTQANPMPILMAITDQATLPGMAKYQVKSCFALGTGYGDLSAERVYVRYSRLSCVDKNDRLMMSAEVSGYVVDSDGKIGLRGKVVDRQGAKLGKALLAGFAQGLAGALGQAQSVVSTSPLGATSSVGGDAALRASGLGGAQTAAQQLAQFYLKEAQAVFPVISVDASRKGTIVFSDNASLVWSSGDSQFVKDVKPE